MKMPVNFVFIITDQQRADHLGCYGNRIVRTPHIDALARDAFRAESCYVASPICQPNRSSIMTGRMPSTHGVRHNGIELDFGQTTFVELLRQAGYRTALVGKSSPNQARSHDITDTPDLMSWSLARRSSQLR